MTGQLWTISSPSSARCVLLFAFTLLACIWLTPAGGPGKIWETPFDVTDASFPCSIDRIRGPLGASDQMYLINHALNLGELGITISDPEDAPTTNRVASCV